MKFYIQRLVNEPNGLKAVVFVGLLADPEVHSMPEYVYLLTFSEDRNQVSNVELIINTARWDEVWSELQQQSSAQS